MNQSQLLFWLRGLRGKERFGFIPFPFETLDFFGIFLIFLLGFLVGVFLFPFRGILTKEKLARGLSSFCRLVTQLQIKL